jgi:membrane protein YqaA with SNARE-associated domain
MDLAFLFVSAFAASTILPMSSEVVLGALAVAGATDAWLLLAVATAGNTLGAVVNWAIGRYAATWRTRLLSLDEASYERVSRWFNRWGIWCLLFSWLPVIGDPLTLVAGVLRTAFVPFVLLESHPAQKTRGLRPKAQPRPSPSRHRRIGMRQPAHRQLRGSSRSVPRDGCGLGSKRDPTSRCGRRSRELLLPQPYRALTRDRHGLSE